MTGTHTSSSDSSPWTSSSKPLSRCKIRKSMAGSWFTAGNIVPIEYGFNGRLQIGLSRCRNENAPQALRLGAFYRSEFGFAASSPTEKLYHIRPLSAKSPSAARSQSPVARTRGLRIGRAGGRASVGCKAGRFGSKTSWGVGGGLEALRASRYGSTKELVKQEEL